MARRAPTLALLAALAACGPPAPLGFAAKPIPVGYDRSPIVDAAAIDPDHDGDLDLLVATADDFRFLEYVPEHRAWVDASAGVGLGDVPPVQAMHPDGDGFDYVIVRDGRLSRLVYSGIGSWSEAPGPVPDVAPAPVLAVEFDLDGDGRLDAARLDGRRLVISWRDPDGVLVDVSRRVGADGLLLPAPATRLAAGDLDGDGDIDLLAVGGRIFALLNNGGRLSVPGDG